MIEALRRRTELGLILMALVITGAARPGACTCTVIVRDVLPPLAVAVRT